MIDTKGQHIVSKRPKLLHKDYSYLLYASISEIDQHSWDAALPTPSFFLCHQYLRCVEELKADQNYFRYVQIFQHHRCIGVVYFQVTDFTANLFGKMIETQFDAMSKRFAMFQSKLEKHNTSTIMRLLTCGNNYVSGEHGFLFDEQIDRVTQLDILQKLIREVARREKLRGRISGILIKDFYQPLPLNKCLFGTSHYIEFKVEPNMLVDIPPQVKSLQDYLACFSKKYRNRAKHILKASETLTTRAIQADELNALYSDIYALYENVYDNAKFKLAKLDAKYFHEMKLIFGDRFLTYGTFHEGKLVSFMSGIILGHELEAHYIGVDYSVNKEFELYQNILYKYIELAIEHNIYRVNLGRTASEIKSTVGARANDLYCYVRPQNTLSRLVLRPFVSFLQPSEWIPRNPFKEE